MNLIRRFLSRSISPAIAVAFVCAGFSAGAQGEASQLINFPAQENVQADDALKGLIRHLEMYTANDEFRSAYAERPGDGLQVERFNQYYKGLRVEHGSFSITSKNGQATHAFGRFYPTAGVAGILPTLFESAALKKAREVAPAEKYILDDGSEGDAKGRLCLIEDFGKGDGDGVLHLAYAFDIYSEIPLARYMVYVDALDGHILFTDAILKHIGATGSSLYSGNVSFNAGKVGAIIYMYDSVRGGGVVTYDAKSGTNLTNATIVTNSTTTFPLDPSVDAHWGAEVVYDYWMNVQNRNSWDGAGGILKSYVHYSSGYNNANWGGNVMRYGDGTGVASGGLPPLTAIDVCGHEIGHGVCQSTANLVYSRESGAMNEGFSDIWGAVIESYGDPHETDATAKDNWLMGEELLNTLRSMKNPKQYQQPDTYLGINWINASSSCTPTGGNDQCGVHYNSGVLNYWFYLLSVGGKGRNDLGNDYLVDSIGMAKAARIAYATELALNSTSNYNSCRTASIAAATTIYGACSPEVTAVTRAWYAVGVGPDPVPCTPQVTFGAPTYPSSENAGSESCQASRVVSLPLSLNGPALTGDSATVTVIVYGGTATPGVDYQLLTPTITFQPGGSASKTIDFLVFDNGAPDINKFVALTYTLNARGSNAIKSVLKDSTRLLIYDDDYEPYVATAKDRTVLNYNLVTSIASPFFGTSQAAHAMYLYTVAELQAAGVRPNVPITQAAFIVMKKRSTKPYYNFNLGIAHTSLKNFGNGLFTGTFTNVYSDSLVTQIGATPMPFNAPFLWNGVDNLVVEICFTNTSTYGYDSVQGRYGPFVMTAHAGSNFNSGCNIVLSTNNLGPVRPVIQLSHTTKVETSKSSHRTWSIAAGKSAYFYSTSDQELIAAMLNLNDSIGCVDVRVTEDGIGFKPASGTSQRSLKEFSVTPLPVFDTVSFEGIFYMSHAELAGVDPMRIKIIQTTSADDNDLRPANTHVITPSDIIDGSDYVGFRGSFGRYGRFFLSDGVPALGVGGNAAANYQLWTGQNPFTTTPILHWTLPASENVSIRMYDVAGRLVYNVDAKLAAGTHQLQLNSPSDLAPGAYVLQVVRPGGVFTRRMMKQ